jgi:uncharacterized membrane-anchored protein
MGFKVADNKSKNPGPQVRQAEPTPFQQYLYANLLWWGFLAVLAIVSFFTCGAVWDDVTEGVMEFIVVILGGGFALVTVLDYVYEKYVARSLSEGRT